MNKVSYFWRLRRLIVLMFLLFRSILLYLFNDYHCDGRTPLANVIFPTNNAIALAIQHPPPPSNLAPSTTTSQLLPPSTRLLPTNIHYCSNQHCPPLSLVFNIFHLCCHNHMRSFSIWLWVRSDSSPTKSIWKVNVIFINSFQILF